MTATALSLGAGVQSTALALMLAHDELELTGTAQSVLKRKAGDRLSVLENLEPPRVAIFADTGWEPAATYQHLERLEAALAAAPRPLEVRRVRAGDIREDVAHRINGTAKRYANLPVYVDTGAGPGREGLLPRQCTREYKLDPIRRELAALGYGPRRPVASLIGISLDEFRRVKPGQGWQHRAHPLVDARLTRHDLELYLERHGWGRVPKSACVGCPLHGDAAWRELKTTSPDEWAQAVEFDELIRDRLPGLKGPAFLHRTLQPLADVDLRNLEDLGQGSLFDNECAGVCGV